MWRDTRDARRERTLGRLSLPLQFVVVNRVSLMRGDY